MEYEQETLQEVRRLRQRLQEEFGAEFGGNGDMPPDMELDWLQYIEAFERQAALGVMTTVRARIGDPPLPPPAALAPKEVPAAIEALLGLLQKHGVGVLFLGKFTPEAAYRYLVEELLDEEIEDIRIPGAEAVFTPMTPAFELGMWVDHFVKEILQQRFQGVEPGLSLEVVVDAAGEPLSAEAVGERVAAVRAHVPAGCRVEVTPLAVEAGADEGWVTAEVWWWEGGTGRSARVTSTFTLRPSKVYGWDVVQTSLFSDLLAAPG